MSSICDVVQRVEAACIHPRHILLNLTNIENS
jgi:hypothetical protein